MTSTHFQRKKSEQGASLIMLVSIIGLAFIVTVAAFLVAASNGQDTARIASAKVDIATREDALMRVILQQTATGMLPGTDGVTGNPQAWANIMTNAVTQLLATTYVDPIELATLPGLTGVIPDNMGDASGTALGILQGYNSTGVPFGGTTGVANVVPSYNATVQPPLMNWSANATLSAATALTTPQEFFLGSQYTPPTSAAVTKLSLSNRWGQILYPNIRFGYKQPGDLFIARRVWWRIPVVYQTAQQTLQAQSGVLRYPSAPANYVLSVYEIPSQLPISGNANLKIGLNADGTAWGSGIQVTGSIYGGQIQLSGGTYTDGISSRQQVNVVSAATVGGVAYANNAFDNLLTRETMALTQATPGAAPVSVAGNDGKVLMVPVMPGKPFYMSVATPTHWDLYARPYYRCRIRIIISGTNSTLIYSPTASPQMSAAANAGAITVNVNLLPDTSSHPDQILGFPDSATTAATGSPYSQTSSADPNETLPAWMTYTSTGTGTTQDRNILVINVGSMVAALGTNAQLYSIYIGSNPTTEPVTPFTASDPGVALTGTSDLHLFTAGLSIVSNQTLYLLDSVNQVPAVGAKPATSIFAPDIRYGISGVNPVVGLVGQVSIDPASTTSSAGNPLSFVDADGTLISTSSASNTFTLTEITDPTTLQMPPIVPLTLLFTVEKERTN
jgi:hypothetical protein